MNNQIIFLLLFILGVFLEALRKVKTKEGFYIFLFSALITLLVFIPGKNEESYGWVFHLWFYIIAFSFVYSVFIAKEALPVINEAVILQYTILYWYGVIILIRSPNADEFRFYFDP